MEDKYLKDTNPVAYEELEDYWVDDFPVRTVVKEKILNDDTTIIGKWKCPSGLHTWFSTINYRKTTETDPGCIFCQQNHTDSPIELVKQDIHDSSNGKNKIITYIYSRVSKLLIELSHENDIKDFTAINGVFLEDHEHPKSIYDYYPSLVEEWSENNLWAIDKVFPLGECKYAFLWKCKDCGQEYELSLLKKLRDGKRACPYCSGRKVLPKNSLRYKYPLVAAKWNNWMNDKKVDEIKLDNGLGYFECPNCGVIYLDTIKNELDRKECPYCKDGMTKEKLKRICSEYAGPITKKNYLNPEGKSPVDWVCAECKSKYPASMKERFHFIKSCTYCAGKHVKVLYGLNSILDTEPEMMKEWVWDINYLLGLNPKEMHANSRKIAWWKCRECGEYYKQSPSKRLLFRKRKMKSCPHCKGYHRNQHHFF